MSKHRAIAVLGLLAAVLIGCNNVTGAGDGGRAPQAQPGDYAPDYITADNYPSMLVEVAYVDGWGPTQEALDKMTAIFEQRLQKPGHVRVIEDAAIPAQDERSWQIGDILALESQYRRNHTNDPSNRGQAVLWMIYLNGTSEFDEGTTRALGVSYDASSVAIFRENISRTTPVAAQQVVESMVLVHEGGHIFGLVNNGLPMVNAHEDPTSARHDSSPDCVMFHRIDTTNLALLLGSSPPLDYDYQCQLDMYHAGGPPPDSSGQTGSQTPSGAGAGGGGTAVEAGGPASTPADGSLRPTGATPIAAKIAPASGNAHGPIPITALELPPQAMRISLAAHAEAIAARKRASRN